jgi:hypothetical protein
VPRKAAYLEFEADEALEFEYYLADRLKMTVRRLREEMPAAEFMGWQVYHGRRAQRAELATKTRKG